MHLSDYYWHNFLNNLRMLLKMYMILLLKGLHSQVKKLSFRMWMQTAHRDLTNYQWRLVSNAIDKCSLPIFVKLVFAEICRWRSYTKSQDTYLASNVMDSIMMLFERIEKQVSIR